MVIASFAEVLGIGAILPFLGALMSPDQVYTSPRVQPVAQAFGLTEPSQLLFALTVCFIAAALVSGGMRLLLLWSETRLTFAIGADLSIDIYKKTLYQPFSVHVARNSSEVIAGISTKTNTVIEKTLLPLLRVAGSSLMLGAILTALVILDPFVAFVAFAGFGGVYGLVAFATKRRLAYDSRKISNESTQVIKALQEGLGGIRDVLIDGSQETYCKIYRKADLQLRRSQANVQIVGSAPRFLIESLGMVLIALLAYTLAMQEQGISNAIPILGALALGAQRMLPVLQQFYYNWSAIRGGQGSLSDVLDLLDQQIPEHVAQQNWLPMPFTKLLQLNNVGFRYSNDEPWVLKDINLNIDKGSRVGFIGTTGSGKSTLIDLIMGLLTPSEGVLKIDGQPLTSINCRGWQAHIAHVPQNIFLGDTSIAESIAFGVPLKNIDYERVKYAAQQAQIASTIESWSQKYTTKVGERGIRLSGGQRQRIGIARALYKRADVIVFDEATSALDNETEKAVMEAIGSLGENTTILIVAHRLTTLKDCDRIVEFEKGRIKRAGTYSEIVTGLD